MSFVVIYSRFSHVQRYQYFSIYFSLGFEDGDWSAADWSATGSEGEDVPTTINDCSENNNTSDRHDVRVRQASHCLPSRL